ncbi:hypothetical protein [Rhodopseudomonas sp. P2A-2r]|uniref:hypothetical protein n=1 Tax=unclassified Rhodopseudomonas TaxID=2638247 RepID=UPI00223404C1|nr:hypothetical protein [Rhodopseudomonas sp. P2A-2r]UZE52240.1 hypothetical protein ONR75_21075 [Rhodopseudomonas sp. P2A-2r]
MKTQKPIIREQDEHRVLKFVPRSSAHASPIPSSHSHRAPLSSEHDDLARYRQDRDEPDDFRHRMLANTAAFALTAALTGIGIWLAISIADLRKTQDCVLMGRRDCAHIASTPP